MAVQKSHNTRKFSKPNLLRRFVAETKLAMEIGIGWLYYPRQFFMVIAAIGFTLNYLGIEPSKRLIGIICAVGIIVVFALGKLDLKFLKVYETQQGLQAGKYNYFFREKLGE